MPDQVVPIHATVLPEQQAMILQFAKDEGLLSASEALRRILTEWRRDRAAELPPANPIQEQAA